MLKSLSVFLSVELQEGTFLVLEMAQEYENNGDYTRGQGKCLSLIRGVLSHLKNFSVTNKYFQPLSAQNFSADLLFTSTFRFV